LHRHAVADRAVSERSETISNLRGVLRRCWYRYLRTAVIRLTSDEVPVMVTELN
jgi:hypothetical protein